MTGELTHITNMKAHLRATQNPLVSIVVPVFNEASAIPIFIESAVPILVECSITFEILFVNDGSTDGTLNLLMEQLGADSRLCLVNLSRNFGKEAALTAGIDQAQGDVVVPMDVDLQDPPELIPAFLERWRAGYDTVYGVRTVRDEEGLVKRATAGIFYRVFNRLSDTGIPANAGDFRLMDRQVVEALRQCRERNRFMKGLFSWVGFTATSVDYERPRRHVGSSKWVYWRLWNFAIDGLTAFTTVPLRVWTYVGAIVALVSFLYAFVIVLQVLVEGISVPGYASLITVVLFLGGVQLLSLGLIGEYLGRLFDESKARPIYLLEGVYGGGELTTNETSIKKKTESEA